MNKQVFEGTEIKTCDCEAQPHDAIVIDDEVHFACRNCHRTSWIEVKDHDWKPRRTFLQRIADDTPTVGDAIMVMLTCIVLAVILVVILLTGMYVPHH